MTIEFIANKEMVFICSESSGHAPYTHGILYNKDMGINAGDTRPLRFICYNIILKHARIINNY